MSIITSSIVINNFKSIRHAELQDCRRINLFIGKPNVGKSNILEAISTFSIPYLHYSKKQQVSVNDFIRIENDSEIFFDGNTNAETYIESSILRTDIYDDGTSLNFEYSIAEKGLKLLIPFKAGKIFPNQIKGFSIADFPFKTYLFPNVFNKQKNAIHFLLPPDGSNLMYVVSQLPNLKKELTNIFDQYDLKYVFDTNSQEIKIIKERNPGEIFLIPFQSIADTLQRIIFYKAAIESNNNSILIFEEPEAHAYPPYITKMAQSIIDSKSNQFFITTHSPYVVNEFLAMQTKELAIYLVDYKNGETIVKRASDKELDEMYDYGVDLFFNTETFL